MTQSMPYQAEYDKIFDSESGRETFEATRQAIAQFAGEFSSNDVISAACRIRGCVSPWDVLNTLDHLVTLGELRELTDRDNVAGQHRIYVASE